MYVGFRKFRVKGLGLRAKESRRARDLKVVLFT